MSELIVDLANSDISEILLEVIDADVERTVFWIVLIVESIS